MKLHPNERIPILILITLLLFISLLIYIKHYYGTITGYITAIGGLISKVSLVGEVQSKRWCAVLGDITIGNNSNYVSITNDYIIYKNLFASKIADYIIIFSKEELNNIKLNNIIPIEPSKCDREFNLTGYYENMSNTFKNKRFFRELGNEFFYLLTNPKNSSFYLIIGNYSNNCVFITFSRYNKKSFDNSLVDYQVILPRDFFYYIYLIELPSETIAEKPVVSKQEIVEKPYNETYNVSENISKEYKEYNVSLNISECHYVCTEWNFTFCLINNTAKRTCWCTCEKCYGPKPPEEMDCEEVKYVEMPLSKKKVKTEIKRIFIPPLLLVLIILSTVFLSYEIFYLITTHEEEKERVKAIFEFSNYIYDSLKFNEYELALKLYKKLLKIYLNLNKRNKKRFLFLLQDVRNRLLEHKNVYK